MPVERKRYPKDWKTAPLGSVASVVLSGVDKKSSDQELPVRLCNYTDAYYNDYITGRIDFMQATASPSEIERLSLRQGDVLITKDSETPDDIGVSALVAEELENIVCGYHLALIRPIPQEVSGGFLNALFKSPELRRYFSRRAHGVTRFGLTRDVITEVEIPIPPIEQQKRIHLILFSLDMVISRTRAVIEQTRRLKTALLQDLLTNGLPGRHRKLVNHPRLGRIPANWRVAPLGRLCVSAVDGPFGSNLKTEHYSQSGVRVIRLQNIAVGEFDDSDRAFVPWHHFEGLKEYEALPGDLLIASMGDESHPAGRACLVPDRVCPAMIKADCFRFRVDAEQASPQYLMWFMNSYMARREIDRGSHGQTRTRLNLTNAKKVCVPIPDLPEQKIIAKMIDALHRRELSERKELIGLDNVQSALRHGLLTGKIRVEARGARDA